MHTAQSLIYTLTGSPAVDGTVALIGTCCLCGLVMDTGVPRKVAIKNTFNDHDKLRAPNGVGFCPACAYSFSENIVLYGRERQRMRTYSHLVDADGWQVVNKADKPAILQFLLSDHVGSWFACLADIGQKHLLFRCPVNVGGGQFRLLLEERVIHTDQRALTAALDIIDRLLVMGFSKSEIESGLYSQHRLRMVDLGVWRALETHASAWRGSGAWALGAWLAQRRDDGSGTSSGSDQRDSSVDQLGDVGVETPDVLGDDGERDPGQRVHDEAESFYQPTLF